MNSNIWCGHFVSCVDILIFMLQVAQVATHININLWLDMVGHFSVHRIY